MICPGISFYMHIAVLIMRSRESTLAICLIAWFYSSSCIIQTHGVPKSNLFSPEKTTSAAGFRDVSTPIGSMSGIFTDIYHQ